jgi:hypothetical protein
MRQVDVAATSRELSANGVVGDHLRKFARRQHDGKRGGKAIPMEPTASAPTAWHSPCSLFQLMFPTSRANVVLASDIV